MKTIKYKIIVFLLIITNCSLYAQYNGGDADGSSLETISVTSCAIPASFFTYFGGESDGATVDTFENTTCPFSNHFYTYFGGQNDGAAVETLETESCGFPPQFYTYFGGESDGSVVDITAPICPTEPPVANFTASATSICVGQSVTFTDTSTNIPSAWIWTLPGGIPNTSTDQNPTVIYNTPGTYSVTLKAANYNGNDTKVQSAYIVVTAYPSVTSTIAASRCGSGTVTLNATASAGTLSWYSAISGGSIIGTGTSFVTPAISATTTYYVETVNASCSSSRTAVVATINLTPTITGTTPANRCGAGSLTLGASSSAGNTIWYANPTGGTALATTNSFVTPSLSTTTTYYVEASTGLCTSPRTAVIATVNILPTITTTTSASRCDSGSVTLQATASSGILNWYSVPTGGTSLATGGSFATPSLTTTTTYYVEASVATCPTARVAVIATINQTPGIMATSAGSRCDAGTVTLGASASGGIVSWYAAATGGTALATGASFTTPSISTTTTYFVGTAIGTCISPRVPVVATINPSPTITSTTPTTICGGTFTISATASAGTLAWYNVPTGGIVQGTGNNFSLSNWPATTTFYVQATNGSCQSARIPVEVTVIGKPFNTALYPANRCGTGTVTLGAEYTIGTANWYTVASGGTAVASGPTFTTPSISTTTTYYVEGINNGCVSEIRTPITATVNQQPTITSTIPASRCGSGVVALSATATVGTVAWYTAASGGTPIFTGTNFSPNLSATTTYYVEASNGSCTSTRTAITATIDPAQTIISTTPGNRCDAGTVTLSAVASGGTLNWYAASSGGPILASGSSFTTPSLSSSTTYYVEVTNGTCTSTRVAVVASVNGLAAPTGNANQSFCGSATVGSLVTTSGTNIVWYTAATGGTVVPNATALVSGTTYYASQNNGTCESATRLAVTATISANATITATIPASRCGNGTVTLQASASSGTISWFANATGGTALATGGSFTTPNLSATTTYYVEVTNGSCTSTRTAVVATINALPTITATNPASRCGNGTVTLQASASSGTISWYSALTGGTALATGGSFTTPSLSATTTYYVEVTNGSCTSTRTAVVATINALPTITATTPASRCGNGTVTLQASASSGTISWYSGLTGGTALATGGSFTTPNLSSTTTYYVEVTNGSCTSTRTAVVATIISTTAPAGIANQTFCAGETVGLITVANGTDIIWYDAPTGGNVVSTSTTIVSGTTYYASQTLNNCESSIRLAVTITLGNCLGTTDFIKLQMSVYPNPTKDFVIVNANQVIEKVELINLLGQTLFSKPCNENEVKVYFDNLPTATYLLRVTSENNAVSTFKIIKQ